MTPMQEAYQMQQAYIDGVYAHRAGLRETACPYRLSSPKALAWVDGWKDATDCKHDVSAAAVNLAAVTKYPDRPRIEPPADYTGEPQRTAARILAGGQGRSDEDVHDAAMNVADIGKYALAFIALAVALILLARGCIGNSPHFLVAVVCVLALSGCSGDFRKMELIDKGGRDPAATRARRRSLDSAGQPGCQCATGPRPHSDWMCTR